MPSPQTGFLVLAYVQVIFSPGARVMSMVASVVVASNWRLEVQTTSLSAQPAVGFSVMEYAPGKSPLIVFELESVTSASSSSEKLSNGAVPVNEKSCTSSGCASFTIVIDPLFCALMNVQETTSPLAISIPKTRLLTRSCVP